MKRFILIILALAVAAGCCACGRSGGRKSGAKHDAAERSPVVEVEMTMENFYDYFEYHEFHSPTKNDDGVTTSMQILCDGHRFDITSVEDVRGKGMYVEVLAKVVEPDGKSNISHARGVSAEGLPARGPDG